MSEPDGSVLAAGARFGPYRILGLIGRGGMGEVYRAADTRKHDRVVALKILPARFAADPIHRARFESEAKVVGSLGEPHVVPIHEYGTIDGTFYIDMRLAPGTRSLRDRVREQMLSAPAAVQIVEQVAAALDAAHERGLVHRDVKSENILVDENRFAYLIDFGIALDDEQTRQTEMGMVVGSLPYMAPERFRGQGDTTRAVDVYALGCVLYEALTGRPPFGNGPAEAVMHGHLSGAPALDDPRVSPSMRPILAQALAKDPAARPATAGRLAAQARAALETDARSAAATAPAPAWVEPEGRSDTGTDTEGVLPTRVASEADAGEGPPERATPERPRLGRFLAAGAVAVLLLGGVWYWQSRGSDDAHEVSGAPASGDRPTATSGAQQTGDATAADGSPSPGTCTTASGVPASCAAGSTYLLVEASSCDVDGVVQALGVDSSLQPLIEAEKVAGSCAARPTAAARAHGATAATIKALPTRPAASLLSCTSSPEGRGDPIPCSQPHRAEFVGGWQPLSGDPDVRSQCRQPAAQYSGRGFDGADQDLEVVLLEGKRGEEPVYRCAISSRDTLRGSVWKLAGKPLPTA